MLNASSVFADGKKSRSPTELDNDDAVGEANKRVHELNMIAVDSPNIRVI